jgi:putative membrane protein
MMKTLVSALALGAIVLSFPAFADDAQILSDIHHANQKEITLATLAGPRSTDPNVQNFAKKLIADHQQADRQTLDLANKLGIKISSIPMSQVEKATQAKLAGLEGISFDKEFTTVMLDGHANVISKLGTAQKEAKSPEVKQLISSLLPTLQHHHATAEMLQKNVKAIG